MVADLEQAIADVAQEDAAPMDVERPGVDYDSLFVDDGAPRWSSVFDGGSRKMFWRERRQDMVRRQGHPDDPYERQLAQREWPRPGRAESEINLIKQGARPALRATATPLAYGPLVARRVWGATMQAATGRAGCATAP